jgi:hypothetical protein
MVWDSFPVRLKVATEVSRAAACGCCIITIRKVVSVCMPCPEHAGKLTISMGPEPDSLATLTFHRVEETTADDLDRLATMISEKASEMRKGWVLHDTMPLYPAQGGS